MLKLNGAKLETLRRAMVKARTSPQQRQYFYGVAQARYILRKVFRLVEEEAKRAGVDPLAHQALIQIYGSPAGQLRIKEVAERLDITPAFTSSLIKLLLNMGYVVTEPDRSDKRVSWVRVTKLGHNLLRRVDEQVQIHVDYFAHNLTASQTEAALSILIFYAGASLRPDSEPQRLRTHRKKK